MVSEAKIRITLEEYRALPEVNRHVELIDGELIMPPTPVDAHQAAVNPLFIFLLQTVKSGQIRVAPLDVYLDENIVQPDVFWVSGENSRCTLGSDGYWYGAPDLVVEILSPSTEANDRGKKFWLYQQYGVREYWLVHPTLKYVEVFRLIEGKFDKLGLFKLEDTFISEVLGGQSVEINVILVP